MISFQLTVMQLSERPEFFVLRFCLRKQRYKVQFVQVWGPQFITNSSLVKKSEINIKMLKHVVFCAIFSSLEAMNLSGNNLMIGGDPE